MLNLGHTFGHAIESATGYTEWLHGEAVGVGLLMAAALSYECGLLPHGDVERLRGLLTRAGLPTRVRGVAREQMLEHMRIDKKVEHGRVRFVLLRGIGTAFLSADSSEAALYRTLAAHLE